MTARTGGATGRGDDGAGARFKVTCQECGRVFDLMDVDDNEEWVYGHDCEATG